MFRETCGCAAEAWWQAKLLIFFPTSRGLRAAWGGDLEAYGGLEVRLWPGGRQWRTDDCSGHFPKAVQFRV